MVVELLFVKKFTSQTHSGFVVVNRKVEVFNHPSAPTEGSRKIDLRLLFSSFFFVWRMFSLIYHRIVVFFALEKWERSGKMKTALNEKKEKWEISKTEENDSKRRSKWERRLRKNKSYWEIHSSRKYSKLWTWKVWVKNKRRGFQTKNEWMTKYGKNTIRLDRVSKD